MVEFVRDPATCEKVRFIQKLVQLRVVLLALLLGHQRHNKDTHYNSSEGSATARDRQSGTDDTVDGLLADLWRHPITTTPKTMRDGIMTKQKTRIAFIARDELSQ